LIGQNNKVMVIALKTSSCLTLWKHKWGW